MAVDALTFILKMLRFGVTVVQQGVQQGTLSRTLSRDKGARQGTLSRTLSRDKVRDKVPCCTPYRANTKGPISIIVMTIGNCKQGKDKGQLAISCNQVIRSATRRKAVHKVQTHVP